MAEPENRTPNVIGGYEIIAKLGQGGMGAVFKARQSGLDRIVALKVLPPAIAKDAEFIERFQREARACAKLNHPNIVQGIAVGQDEATRLWYFAMEFVDGPSLKDVLERDKTIPERRALEMVRDIARALECAERHGIVHRDIKPDNILLDAQGLAKLADLGLAKQKQEDASLTQTGMAVGTPYYMAPEQAKGLAEQIDVRTDLYSLGATLFHLVTGQTLFTGPTGPVIMAKHLTEKPPLAHRITPHVSEACSRLIARLVQKPMNLRVQSPAELVKEIDGLLAQGVTAEFHHPVSSRVDRTTSQRAAVGTRQAPIRGGTTGPRAPVGSAWKAARGTSAGRIWMGLGVAAGVALLVVFFLAGGTNDQGGSGAGTKQATTPPVRVEPPPPPASVTVPQPPDVKTPSTGPVPIETKNTGASHEATGTTTPPVPQLPVPQPEEATSLRERLLLLGRNAPRDQVKRLGELPQPAEAEKMPYCFSPAKANLDGWRRDYDSTVTGGREAGEPCLVVRKGTKDRAACYRELPFAINRTRIRMRIYQSGLRALSFSVLTRLGTRFSVPIGLPAERTWTNVDVDISKALTGDIKAANQPVQHLEIHGFPKSNLPAVAEVRFCLAKFEWINGEAAADHVATPETPPAQPVPVDTAPDGEVLARAAYAAFTVTFLSRLCEGDVKAAAEQLARAEKDPRLAILKNELARDRKALSWVDDADQAVLAGAEQLKTIAQFTLHLKQGAPMTVGKRAPFQVIEVKNETLQIGNKGMTVPVALDKLHFHSRLRLALLGMGRDAAVQVRRAWLELLSMGNGPNPFTANDVRAALVRAQAAGAAEEDLAYLRSHLDAVEKGARELAATAAWEGLLKLDQDKQWKPLLAAMQTFMASHSETALVKQKGTEIETLKAKAEKAVELSEGYRFTFDTPEDFARFKRVFSNLQPQHMAMVHENGNVVFRRKEGDKLEEEAGFHLQADALKLGRNWDLTLKVDLKIGVKEIRENSASGRHAFMLRFMKPGEKGGWGTEAHARFHLEMVGSYGGFFCCSLRGPGQYDNGQGKGWGPFEGLKQPGPCGGGFLERGKAKPPAGADGKYELNFVMRESQMKITVNGKVIEDTPLPPAALELIAASPLALYACGTRQAREIVLEELFFKSRDEPK